MIEHIQPGEPMTAKRINEVLSPLCNIAARFAAKDRAPLRLVHERDEKADIRLRCHGEPDVECLREDPYTYRVVLDDVTISRITLDGPSGLELNDIGELRWSRFGCGFVLPKARLIGIRREPIGEGKHDERFVFIPIGPYSLVPDGPAPETPKEESWRDRSPML